MSINSKYDLCIIGAGIAGLALAEISARSGKKVLLIEKNSTPFSEASADHHGWFHMGSLYSIFLKNHFSSTLLGGLDDLIKYYSIFENMNLKISNEGKIVNLNNDSSNWFTGNYLNFYLHRFNIFHSLFKKNFSKNLIKECIWYLQLRKFIQRHNLFNKYIWNYNNLSIANKIISNANFKNYSKKNFSFFDSEEIDILQNDHFRVPGFDQTINSKLIGENLFTKFIQQGGEIQLNTSFKKYIKLSSNKIEIQTDKNSFFTDKLVITSGKWTNEFIDNSKIAINLKKIISPLMVVFPNIANENFVRMSPFMNQTFNHLVHDLGGIRYSVIGSGYQINDTSTKFEKNNIEKSLYNLSKKIFKKNLDEFKSTIYWGTKTELLNNNSNRNYQYVINRVDDDIWMILPGKFSLGFSSAVNAYKKIFKNKPSAIFSPKLNKSISVNILDFPYQTHTNLALELYKKNTL